MRGVSGSASEGEVWTYNPFDRSLAAQAIVEDMAIMTIDRRIADLGAWVVG